MSQSKAYKDMTAREKMVFVAKLAVCIVTFGFVFPNVMTD